MKLLWEVGLTESRATDVGSNAGRLRYEADGKVYRWVKNTEASTALAQGQSVCHLFSDGADAFKNVKIPLTANLALLGGVVMSTSIAAGEYGWIQVLGLHETVSVFQSQTTVKSLGTILKAGNTLTYLDTDVASGTAPTLQRNVTLLETVATVTTGAAANKKAYVNCL